MKDTITAVATSTLAAGIGIIRISGKDAINIATGIFRPSKKNKILSQQKTHTIHYGHIVNKDEVLDEVLVSIMKGPNTFTKEDVVEINCHGGRLVIGRVLDLIIKSGARMAEPGEFTKRAFLNGRLDLSQAEAVIDIINAKTDLALKSSLKQLKGSVSEKVKDIRFNLLSKIALIEAAIDYPEDDLEDLEDGVFSQAIKILKNDVEKLLESAQNGKVLKEGIKTVIIGKPNVGKSSLLNALLRDDRAIVTDIPGTTRDTLEELVHIHGIPLNIIDTAGIRNTEDIVEKIGVEKSLKSLKDADLVLFVVDLSCSLDQYDIEIIERIKDMNVIILLNKSDLNSKLDIHSLSERLNKDMIYLSAKEGIGLDVFENKLKSLFFDGKINLDEEVYITNLRHKHCLENTINSLEMVLSSISMGMPEDCYSIDMKNAYDYLGEIIGEAVSDNLIDQIFSQFCLGK